MQGRGHISGHVSPRYDWERKQLCCAAPRWYSRLEREAKRSCLDVIYAGLLIDVGTSGVRA